MRTVEENKKILDQIAEQRTAEANGAPIKYVHYVPEDDELEKNPYPDMIIGNQYYRHEARHPNSPNLFRFTGMANRITFDAYEFIPQYLDRPFLIIAGSEAGSLWQSKIAYDMANEPKELCIMEGAGHFDFYNNAHYIDKATEKMAKFFAVSLN